MKPVYWLVGLLLLVLGIIGVLVGSGAYNVAADEPHWALTQSAMEKLRSRSVVRRAAGIAVPELEDESLIMAGAGNYDAMCAGCHLKPGVDSTEMSRGLYPAPPDFVSHPVADAAAAFWVIKHGIKMSGMPAWGKSMADEDIWGMVAFLRRLPELPAEKYHELVEASGGHRHGGSENGMDDEHPEVGHANAEHAPGEPHSHEAGAPPHKH